MSHQWIERQFHHECDKRVFLDPSSCEDQSQELILFQGRLRSRPPLGEPLQRMSGSYSSIQRRRMQSCPVRLTPSACHFAAWYFSLLIAPPRYNSVARSSRACSACSASTSVARSCGVKWLPRRGSPTPASRSAASPRRADPRPAAPPPRRAPSSGRSYRCGWRASRPGSSSGRPR